MNNSPMCFGAEDNNFDSFFVPSSGKLELVKLVRLNGNVTCDNTHWSFWGCGGNLQDVNVVIKTLADSIILPSREFFTSGEQKESLRIPGYNSFSPKLVLSAVSNPPHVTGGQKLRLWYGQNSRNNTEAKNGGRSCCDVYVRLM